MKGSLFLSKLTYLDYNAIALDHRYFESEIIFI